MFTRFDADGRPINVSGAMMANVPAVRVRGSANQSINNSTNTPLNFDIEEYDTDGIHDLVTNNTRLTIRTAGKYLLHGNCIFAANATGIRAVFIQKNGTTRIAQVGDVNATAATDHPLECTGVQDCIPGDYFEFLVFQTSGGALNVLQQNNWSPSFDAVYLGPTLASTGANAAELVVQSLPASAPNGTILLLEVDAANGIYWRFRYNAFSGSGFKWQFLGGPPLRSLTGTSQTFTLSGTPFTRTAITGVSINLPRAGDYIVHYSATGFATAVGSADIRVEPRLAGTGIQKNLISGQCKAVNDFFTWSAYAEIVGGAAGQTVDLACQSATASVGMDFRDREILLTPVRVS